MHRRLSPSLLRYLLRSPPFQQLSSPILPPSIPAISSQTRYFQPAQSIQCSSPRNFSAGSSGQQIDVNKEVDEINLKFAEAREEIESAMESKETVYFNEEADCARVAVNEVLDLFKGLLNKVEEKERLSLQRSMGLKMEQLKAELQQLDE